MNLREVTPEVEAVLRGDVLEHARIVDIYLDGGTRHYWERFHPLTLDDGVEGPIVYEPVGDRLITPDEVSEDQSLDDSTIDIHFDSSRITDSSDFLGGLLDEPVLQRRVRIRSVLFAPGSNHTVPVWLFNEQNGVIDQSPDRIQIGRASRLTFRIASGTFAYLERRNANYSDADQQVLYPGDTGLSQLPQLVDYSLPWGGEF